MSTGIELVRCISAFDEDGHFAPKYDENDILIIDADHVILSVGQYRLRQSLDGRRQC